LRGGSYPGIFLSKLTGTAERPIIVRNYNNESVTLDANVRTTLAQPVDPTTKTLTLTDASVINPRVWMWLLVENDPAESVQVTAINGNELTVKRGYNGTTAREHTSGITVRPADQAILTVEGAHTWFWGMEFTNTDLMRVTDISASHPYNGRNNGLDVTSGQGIRIINTVWHDLGSGFGVWSTAADFVGYGNLIYHSGWDSPDRIHGHGIYTQNNTPSRLFSDNILWGQFKSLINQYGSNSAVLDNITWEGNIIFQGFALFGGEAPVRNLTLRENFFYGMEPQFGYASRANDGLILEGNYFGNSSFYPRWWTNVNFSGNTVARQDFSCPINITFAGSAVPPSALETYEFSNNHYYWSSPTPSMFQEIPNCWRNETGQKGNDLFSVWQSYGMDVNSTVTMLPYENVDGVSRKILPSPVISLRVNSYESNRAHLIIYNWSKSDTVTVPAQDLRGFLQTGEEYRLSNVQDYFGDRELGTYDGSGLKIAMTGRSVAKPIGYDEVESWYNGPPSVKSTFPEFGVFVLETLSPAISQIAPPENLHVTPTPLP
jgi:hypothetical protein